MLLNEPMATIPGYPVEAVSSPVPQLQIVWSHYWLLCLDKALQHCPALATKETYWQKPRFRPGSDGRSAAAWVTASMVIFSALLGVVRGFECDAFAWPSPAAAAAKICPSATTLACSYTCVGHKCGTKKGHMFVCGSCGDGCCAVTFVVVANNDKMVTLSSFVRSLSRPAIKYRLVVTADKMDGCCDAHALRNAWRDIDAHERQKRKQKTIEGNNEWILLLRYLRTVFVKRQMLQMSSSCTWLCC